jgi:SAM-dependent methyltransferase
MRVLDVAAGTGNAAMRAAQAGADVTASDLTPELLEAGRRHAEAEGLELDWVEADAEKLPFDGDPWEAGPLPPLRELRPLPAGAVLKRFGPSGVRVGDEDLADVLTRAYASFAASARP